jgi:DMSO reductase family type II enzyme chaperone
MTGADSAHARAELYGLLAELLSFPTHDLAAAISAGEIAHLVHMLAPSLPYPIDANPEGLATDVDGQDLESEYIRLFDLPGGGPSCPLYTGVFSPSRREAMEEILRFYRFFGLTSGGDGKDLPDAVPTVLEFVQFLALRDDAAAAQRDVLARHLVPWIAATSTRLPKRSPGPFYSGVLSLCREFLNSECAYLESQIGPAGSAQFDPSR